MTEQQPGKARVERIVVLADPEDPRPTSVRWAATLARALRVPSVLLAPNVVDSAEKAPGERAEELGRTVAVVRRWLEELGVGVDEIEVTTDEPADAFSEMVHRGDIGVIGSGDVVGVTSFALGAVQHGLARTLDCPLIVVPPHARLDAAGPIVVGLDGGEAASVLRAWATTVAGSLDREVVGVHATSSDDATSVPASHPNGMDVRETVGSPQEVIRDTVEQLDAVLVIVTVKRDGAAGGLLVGATADDLLHEPPTALAIITHEYLQSA